MKNNKNIFISKIILFVAARVSKSHENTMKVHKTTTIVVVLMYLIAEINLLVGLSPFEDTPNFDVNEAPPYEYQIKRFKVPVSIGCFQVLFGEYL